MNEKLKDSIKTTHDMSHIQLDQIPSLDLYMDQILTLFDVHLEDNKRSPDDKLLTKTMINNYSKEGLLNPIKGKKYTKDHILQMLMIYLLKNTISIQEVKSILSPYHEHLEDITPLYTNFLEKDKDLSNEILSHFLSFVENNKLDSDNENDRTLILLLICSLSRQFQRMAESMLDQYYIQDKEKTKQ